MSLTDEENFELQRRRLEDAVKSKVEAELFRYYRNLGSIIITILAAVGIAIGWPQLKGIINDEISHQISKQVEIPVAKAREVAEHAQDIAEESLANLEAQQENLISAIGRVRPKLDDIQVQYGSASEQIKSLVEQTEEMRELQAFLKTQAQSNPIKREEFAALETRISNVVGQIQVLAESLKTLNLDSTTTAQITQVEEGLGFISTEIATTANQVRTPQEVSTVYVQFAGGARSDIVLVTDKLRADGWRVPGEERTPVAAGKRLIRYYYDYDKQAAEALANDLSQALEETGFASIKPIVTEKLDPTDFKTPPVEGILEVWLEIPLR
jgi:hypothetical protein